MSLDTGLTITDPDVTTFDEGRLNSETTFINIRLSGICELLTTKVYPNIVVLSLPKGCVVNLDHFPNLMMHNHNLIK